LDAAGFGEERVPGRAAGIEDVLGGRPEAVREETLTKIEPDPFDGVELGRVGGRNSGVRLAGTARSLAMGQPARSMRTIA
jgi:hypothetical protein